MPRKARQYSLTGVYHIIARGVAQQIIFYNDSDRSYYIKILQEISLEENAEVLAWCLMSNHVHLLIRITDPPGHMMKRLNTKYALYINHFHDRVGPLFQDRFKSEIVDTPEYLMTVTRYIHQNPVRAGIAESCLDYKWSSYYDYLTSGKSCNTEFVLAEFNDIKDFEEYHNYFLQDKRDEPMEYLPARLSDEQAMEIIIRTIGEERLSRIRAVEKQERNQIIRNLYKQGIRCRQLARLTGFGSGTISEMVRAGGFDQ